MIDPILGARQSGGLWMFAWTERMDGGKHGGLRDKEIGKINLGEKKEVLHMLQNL